MNEEHMQSTNFEFLRPAWPELAELGAFSELYVQSDPPSSRFKSRLLAEHLAMFVCKELGIPIVDGNFLAMLNSTLAFYMAETLSSMRMPVRRVDGATTRGKEHMNEKTTSRARYFSRWWILQNSRFQTNRS